MYNILTHFDEEKFKARLRKEGREEGEIAVLASLVKKSRLTETEAAEEADISVEEFRERVNQKSGFRHSI